MLAAPFLFFLAFFSAEAMSQLRSEGDVDRRVDDGWMEVGMMEIEQGENEKPTQ